MAAQVLGHVFTQVEQVLTHVLEHVFTQVEQVITQVYEHVLQQVLSSHVFSSVYSHKGGQCVSAVARGSAVL